ncbi:PP2C family protein-serine/threonine phosphatase [Silvibacterium acidisoli]|uniref:PP2C family protein-serine/threonine phosphatase n=1 Tax=Acidobacteriaceae bacterium ZG23-2 TaxID=2883246 RepID=UPI00406C4951
MNQIHHDEGTGNAPMKLEVAAVSDIGHRRGNNEDCFGYDLGLGLFIVCDGMGGMAGGEVASSLAVEQAIEVYESLSSSNLPVEERLHTAIEAANETVWHEASKTPALRGMGTTLVAACFNDQRIVIGNVGDSRGYFLRGNACTQITEDHSVAAERTRDAHSLSAEQIPAAVAQYITRAIGAESHVQPDYYTAEIRSGDAILLATDGLTRYVDEAQISDTVQAFDSAEEACRALLAIAHSGGAVDNVTCMVILIH